MSGQANPEKKFSIKRLKAMGASIFEGTSDLTNAEALLSVIEKYFRAMQCLEKRKVDLDVFLLQKGAEDGGL